MAGAGDIASAAIGAVVSVLVNNLPGAGCSHRGPQRTPVRFSSGSTSAPTWL